MRKFLYPVSGFVLSAVLFSGCNLHSAADRAQREEDSIRNADSLARIESMLKQIEQAHEDSLRMDSIAKAEDKDS